MGWIKRNLFFFIGSLVALGLMGFGGYLLFTQISEENKVAEDIRGQYSVLTQLNQANPHPGYGAIDNVKASHEHEATLRAYINKIRGFFQRTTPIPDLAAGKIGNADFAAELRNTTTQLRHMADQQGVVIPPDYYFTFESQRKLVVFDPTGLDKLAIQLGDIKSICDILFSAKINSLDGIRREISSVKDDLNTPDYLLAKTTSTPLADLVPYEVSFKCFSTELAAVLSSLANSPYGFIVKTIDIIPTTGLMEEPGNMNGATMTQPPPRQAPAPYLPPEGIRRGMRPLPVTAPAPMAVAASAKGPTVFLNEKPFRVILMIEVVKLKSAAK